MEYQKDVTLLYLLENTNIYHVCVLLFCVVIRFCIILLELLSYLKECIHISQKKKMTFKCFGEEYDDCKRTGFVFSLYFAIFLIAPILAITALSFFWLAKTHFDTFGDLTRFDLGKFKGVKRGIFLSGSLKIEHRESYVTMLGFLLLIDMAYTLFVFERITFYMCLSFISTPDVLLVMQKGLEWNAYFLIPILVLAIAIWKYVISWFYKLFVHFYEFDKECLPHKILKFCHENTFDVMFLTTQSTTPQFFAFKYENKDAIFLDYSNDLLSDEEVSAVLFHEIYHVKMRHIDNVNNHQKYIYYGFACISQLIIFWEKYVNSTEHLGPVVFCKVYLVFCLIYVPVQMYANFIHQKMETDCDKFAATNVSSKAMGRVLIKLHQANNTPFYHTHPFTLLVHQHPSLYRRLIDLLEYKNSHEELL